MQTPPVQETLLLYINEDMGVHAWLALKTNWHTHGTESNPSYSLPNYKDHQGNKRWHNSPNDEKESVQKRPMADTLDAIASIPQNFSRLELFNAQIPTPHDLLYFIHCCAELEFR